MKKILFLEQFSKISGGQVVLLQILKELDKNKYKPYVVIPSRGPLANELETLGIKYFVLPIGVYSSGNKSFWDIIKYFVLSLIMIIRVFNIIAKEKIDLVYANAPRTYVWGTISAWLARKPIIWHLHSIISRWELSATVVVVRVFKVNRIIAISKAVAQPYTKQGILVNVIYNGVDCDLFKAKLANPSIVKKELGIQAEAKIVAYIGQLAKWKGVADFIKAAKNVSLKQSEVIFLLIGDVVFGGQREQDYKRYLIDLTAKLEINQKVHFLGNRTDVPRILSAIDILVVPSIEPEPLSLALLEGMASAKAVVVAAHGGPVEIIDDGVNGRLYPPREVEALAACLEELLGNDDLRLKIGRNALQKVENELSLENFLQQINRVIAEEVA